MLDMIEGKSSNLHQKRFFLSKTHNVHLAARRSYQRSRNKEGEVTFIQQVLPAIVVLSVNIPDSSRFVAANYTQHADSAV